MTSTASQSPTTLSARRPVHPLHWIILWLVLAVVETILLASNAHFDTAAWLSTRSFLNAQTIPSNLWEFFKLFGNPWCTAVIITFLFIASRRRFLIAPTTIAATALAGFLGWLIRSIDGRVRPTHTDGANHWVLFRGFDLHAKDLSFPSGHATLAFATAAVLVYFFPRTKWVVVPLAAICAFSRVAQGAHFYSDVVFGAVLGWTIAWWTCHLISQRFASPQK